MSKKSKTLRLDEDLLNEFFAKYGSTFLSPYVEKALEFAIKDKRNFSLIFWNEFKQIIYE